MKGDKKIIDILNSLLAGELTAVDQYLIHGEMYADMGLGQLAEKALDVSAMLKADLSVEYKVVGELKKAMAACEKAQDYVTRDMLGIQLEDTEMDHAYYLEKQLKLIELVGLHNYQQSQMGSGTPA